MTRSSRSRRSSRRPLCCHLNRGGHLKLNERVWLGGTRSYHTNCYLSGSGQGPHKERNSLAIFASFYNSSRRSRYGPGSRSYHSQSSTSACFYTGRDPLLKCRNRSSNHCRAGSHRTSGCYLSPRSNCSFHYTPGAAKREHCRSHWWRRFSSWKADCNWLSSAESTWSSGWSLHLSRSTRLCSRS